ncbi:MAG: hypothetical protein J4F98_12875 [Acidobacteria bacterium]|nr:hypothetical protein [Acidobacteriota bacterium]
MVFPVVLLLVVAGPLGANEPEAVATAAPHEAENPASLDLESEGDEGCVESDTVMCLQDGRYSVTIEWEKPDGEKGSAKVARPRTKDSGLFYFFDYNNWEVLLKVLDGCAVNEHHWVYAASASDVGMTLVVRDTTLPDQDADGRMLVNSKTFSFEPHSRRAQMPDESDEDYQANVLAKGHPALTASNAFPDACASS